MAVYAIGDIQGCLEPFERLLQSIRFDPNRDRLWLVGDLVNRGPDSAGVLRRVMALGDAAVCVLGNHDLTLLAVAEGYVRPGRRDTFDSVLRAPDRDAMLAWLRACPLVHHDPDPGWTLVHAGLNPLWDLDRALACSAELAEVLTGDRYHSFLAQMFGRDPHRWSDDLRGQERLRIIVNSCTRMRYCHVDGALEFTHKGPPGTQPLHLIPWFRLPGRRNLGQRIVFGHWAALGYYHDHGVLGLDTGCVWGNTLTAQRLDVDSAPVSVPCRPDHMGRST